MTDQPDATDWTAHDLHAALLADAEPELPVTFWGVPMVFSVLCLDSSGELCDYAEAAVVSYVPEAYPADGSECLGKPRTTPAACLRETRRILRDYAPPDAYDAWLLTEAQASGLQPALFAVTP